MDKQIKALIKEALDSYASGDIVDKMFHTDDRDVFFSIGPIGMTADSTLTIGDSYAKFEVAHSNVHPDSIAEVIQTSLMHREIMRACINALESKGWSMSVYRPFPYKGVTVERDGEKALLTDLTSVSITIEGDGFEAVVEDLHQSGVLRARKCMADRAFALSKPVIDAAVDALN